MTLHSEPHRVQLSRKKGWRKPENTVVVARPSKWGNPFRVGQAQVRMPAIDGGDWEQEGRLHKRSGEKHVFMKWSPETGDVFTWHQVEDATAAQCVEMYREYVTGGGGQRLSDFTRRDRTADIRAELGGKNLACWCPLDQPCHADVLLELANGETP